MGLRRGFKTEASALAKEVREELGLGPLDRLDPLVLAAHLQIPVIPLSKLRDSSGGARYFLDVDPKPFSAGTIFAGHKRVIVHNDAHSSARQNSNLAHELGHGLLLHEPQPALDAIGCRKWDQTIEEEADWLRDELLMTREMAVAVARGEFSEMEAQERLQISKRLVTYRLNMTGARKQVERERKARRAS